MSIPEPGMASRAWSFSGLGIWGPGGMCRTERLGHSIADMILGMLWM